MEKKTIYLVQKVYNIDYETAIFNEAFVTREGATKRFDEIKSDIESDAEDNFDKIVNQNENAGEGYVGVRNDLDGYFEIYEDGHGARWCESVSVMELELK